MTEYIVSKSDPKGYELDVIRTLKARGKNGIYYDYEYGEHFYFETKQELDRKISALSKLYG